MGTVQFINASLVFQALGEVLGTVPCGVNPPWQCLPFPQCLSYTVVLLSLAWSG